MKHITIPILILSFFLLATPGFCQETGTAAASDRLELEVFAICRNVVNRTPVGTGSTFPASVGRLYCFTKVVGAQEHTSITHNWFMNGKLKASITLPVKSASWRTWSLKEIKPTDVADWMVEVLDENGDPIESILFFVQ
jgi:hypothetical protein